MLTCWGEGGGGCLTCSDMLGGEGVSSMLTCWGEGGGGCLTCSHVGGRGGGGV